MRSGVTHHHTTGKLLCPCALLTPSMCHLRQLSVKRGLLCYAWCPGAWAALPDGNTTSREGRNKYGPPRHTIHPATPHHPIPCTTSYIPLPHTACRTTATLVASKNTACNAYASREARHTIHATPHTHTLTIIPSPLSPPHATSAHDTPHALMRTWKTKRSNHAPHPNLSDQVKRAPYFIPCLAHPTAHDTPSYRSQSQPMLHQSRTGYTTRDNALDHMHSSHNPPCAHHNAPPPRAHQATAMPPTPPNIA
jgi:hypothetical protein